MLKGCALCATLVLGTLPIANASTQSPDISSLEAYVDAIKQPRLADQIASMEHFLQVAGQSTLRLDALEILVMDYQKMNDVEHGVARAQDLLNYDASNPLAIAVLSANGSAAANRKSRNDEFAAAKRGLGNVNLLHKPEGVSQEQFTQLQQNVRGMLAGAIGMGYLDQQDYEKATTYLQQALAADPNNARYNYGMAEAILAAPNGGTADAYWLMAKAVNMAKGTPNEQQIARDALAKYRENGGSEAVWNQLLAAAAASNPPPAQANGGALPVNSGQAQGAPNKAATSNSSGSSSSGTEPAVRNPASTSTASTSTPSTSTPSASTSSSANSAAATSSRPNINPATANNNQVAQPAASSGTSNVGNQPSAAQTPVNQTPANQPPLNQPPVSQPPVNQPAGTQPVTNPPPASSATQPQSSAPPQASTANPSPTVTSSQASNTVVPAAGDNASTARSPTTQNAPASTTPVIAKATPPARPDNSDNLPESDQPILVSRPPITSRTPVGPTTAPLPDRKPTVAPPPVVTGPIMTAPTGPVSLGILIQTELLSGNNREPILEAMREMARNLRPGDEAFLMAFSNELDFEQDLTENDELLEEGLANLHPKSGAALFEGINFAIQHLKRIGKNGNRVLLIISDGRNVPNSNGVQHLDADVSRVRIDCIGLDVERAMDRANLQKLAYGSGGMTSFVNDPEQIRKAASAMARTIVGEGFANR